MTVQVNLKKQCNGFFGRCNLMKAGVRFLFFFILSLNFPHCVLSNFVLAIFDRRTTFVFLEYTRGVIIIFETCFYG